jgi:hypothetical protein
METGECEFPVNSRDWPTCSINVSLFVEHDPEQVGTFESEISFDHLPIDFEIRLIATIQPRMQSVPCNVGVGEVLTYLVIRSRPGTLATEKFHESLGSLFLHLAIVILTEFSRATLVLAATAKLSGSKSPSDQSVREKFLPFFVGSVGAAVVVRAVFVPATVSGDFSGTHDGDDEEYVKFEDGEKGQLARGKNEGSSPI